MNPRFLRELQHRFLRGGGHALEVPDGALRIDLPPARNPRFVMTAVLFGGPWLVATLVFSAVFIVAAPIDPFLIRVLAWIVAMALLIFVHLLAFMAVWGAFYQARGSEVLVIDDEHVQVLRTGAGITLPARVGRAGIVRVTVLPEWRKRTPQPKIEVKTGRGAVRFGAGVSFMEAEVVAERIRTYFSAEGEARALTGASDLR